MPHTSARCLTFSRGIRASPTMPTAARDTKAAKIAALDGSDSDRIANAGSSAGSSSTVAPKARGSEARASRRNACIAGISSTWSRATTGRSTRLRAAHLGVAQDAEAHLDRHLELADPAVLHEAADPGHLEPVEARQALRGADDRVTDGLLDRVLGHANQLDDLVGLVRHWGVSSVRRWAARPDYMSAVGVRQGAKAKARGVDSQACTSTVGCGNSPVECADGSRSPSPWACCRSPWASRGWRCSDGS